MLPSQLSKKVAKSKTKADEKKKAVVEEVEEEELVIPLHGLSSEDEDSSDDDDDDFQGDGPAVDVAKLPTIAKDDATVRRKLEKAKMKRTQQEERGVVFLGRIPHGFYEDQLKAYFTQFGNVTRLRISRNKRTGASKHYGFIEFDSASVAQIVSETMDNYLLLGHILRCKVIPKDEVHPQLWVGSNRKWRVVPKDRLVRLEHDKVRTQEEQEKVAKRLMKRENQRKRKIEAAGIDYDFDAVSYKKASKTKAS
ncbi:hypothetical protein CPB85DRAFT_1411460 [Mucidula mucida]|nr:hypothetical protein CPB85DRAFT_1411460 [Mucidula mucida]